MIIIIGTKRLMFFSYTERRFCWTGKDGLGFCPARASGALHGLLISVFRKEKRGLYDAWIAGNCWLTARRSESIPKSSGVGHGRLSAEGEEAVTWQLPRAPRSNKQVVSVPTD